jgi:hypothetical protein
VSLIGSGLREVFPKSKIEGNMPHIFVTCTPTEDIRPRMPISIRLWLQSASGGPISLEFDDGTRIADCKQYAELWHNTP